MGESQGLEAGGFPCTTDGCTRPGKAKTRPSQCGACQARASWHRKHPDAPYRPAGYHGKHTGKRCTADDCERGAVCEGLCSTHYNKHRWASGHRPPSVNQEARRAAHLKHRYGLSMEEHDALLAEQDGKCAICLQPPSHQNTRAHWGGKLCVDHCHDSNRVRALLCNNCNLAVGYTKTPTIARAVAAYLELHARTD